MVGNTHMRGNTPIPYFQRTLNALYHMLCFFKCWYISLSSDKSGNVHAQK